MTDCQHFKVLLLSPCCGLGSMFEVNCNFMALSRSLAPIQIAAGIQCSHIRQFCCYHSFCQGYGLQQSTYSPVKLGPSRRLLYFVSPQGVTRSLC